MKIKEALSTILGRSGMSQTQIGERIGVSQVTVSKYMIRDGVTAQNMIKFLEAAGYQVYAVPDRAQMDDRAVRIEPNE